MEPKNQNEFLASQPLKKMIPQLLLSVSLFSFVFSYSSLYSHSPNKFHYFSANSFELLSHALNKNCLFLICNGLLVFLAKTSGLVRPPPGHELSDMLEKRIGDSVQTALDKYTLEEEIAHETNKGDDEKGPSERPKEVSIFIAESEEEEAASGLEDGEKNEEKDESRSCWLFDNDDDKQLYGQEVEEEEEDDDDEEKEEMSTEELNQKFEDFIRRMKEEIIINEARQKVVMVK